MHLLFIVTSLFGVPIGDVCVTDTESDFPSFVVSVGTAKDC